ncbi:SYNA protein, partial [Pygoscelis papua]
AKLERAIANVSKELEKAINEIANSIIALQEEIKLLSQMVIQNRLAIDYLLAAQDGVCA